MAEIDERLAPGEPGHPRPRPRRPRPLPLEGLACDQTWMRERCRPPCPPAHGNPVQESAVEPSFAAALAREMCSALCSARHAASARICLVRCCHADPLRSLRWNVTDAWPGALPSLSSSDDDSNARQAISRAFAAPPGSTSPDAVTSPGARTSKLASPLLAATLTTSPPPRRRRRKTPVLQQHPNPASLAAGASSQRAHGKRNRTPAKGCTRPSGPLLRRHIAFSPTKPSVSPASPAHQSSVRAASGR